MKDANDSSVASKATMVYHNSHVGTHGQLLTQPPEEIGLVEALADEDVLDMYVCALGKFHRDLYLGKSSDVSMRNMLVSLAPMCMGEEVLERNATTEEHTERVEIYKMHLQAQAALTSATTATAAATDAAADAVADAVDAAVAAASDVDVPEVFDVVAYFLAD